MLEHDLADYGDAIRTAVVEKLADAPHKMATYCTLVACINVDKYEFAGTVVTAWTDLFQVRVISPACSHVA